jgi:hypothetical protein
MAAPLSVRQSTLCNQHARAGHQSHLDEVAPSKAFFHQLEPVVEGLLSFSFSSSVSF